MRHRSHVFTAARTHEKEVVTYELAVCHETNKSNTKSRRIACTQYRITCSIRIYVRIYFFLWNSNACVLYTFLDASTRSVFLHDFITVYGRDSVCIGRVRDPILGDPFSTRTLNGYQRFNRELGVPCNPSTTGSCDTDCTRRYKY